MWSVLWLKKGGEKKEIVVDWETFVLIDFSKVEGHHLRPHSSLLWSKLAPQWTTERLFDSFAKCVWLWVVASVVDTPLDRRPGKHLFSTESQWQFNKGITVPVWCGEAVAVGQWWTYELRKKSVENRACTVHNSSFTRALSFVFPCLKIGPGINIWLIPDLQ